MPWSLLSANYKTNTLDSLSDLTETGSDNDGEYKWHKLAITRRDSLLTSLNRICFSWRQLIYNKSRRIITFVFVTILNTAARFKFFTRQTTSSIPSVTTLLFDEDINHSSTSFINFAPQIDLPSLDNSTMAHMLVQQQQRTHRTPNMNLHQTTSTKNESLLPMSHSVDDRIFFYEQDSTSILDLIRRFASEPQISMYHSTSNGCLNQNSPSSSTLKIILPLNEVKERQEEDDVKTINCDTIQPVIVEDNKSDTSNINSSAITINTLNEDIFLNTTSSLNTERHFRRRKRRSSLTQTSSFSSDETESLKTDAIEKIEDNNNQEENSQLISIDSLTLNDNNDKKEESNDATTTAPSSRLRARRVKYRSQRHPSSVSEEHISNDVVEFFVPTEASAPPVPAPAQESPSTPPPSPVTPISPINTNSNTLLGGLKRIGSTGTTKKMVRFADSVGRELAQVQYIQSLIDDDSRDLMTKINKLYVPKTLNFEPKPWSFDIALTSKQILDTRIPKRFFCLFRQPNSEHPDIYLHEIWKSQIKLEHADICLKSSLSSEQCLHGTVWVTNAGYWKNVTVKYTFNRWLNTYEYDAQHRRHSNDFRNIDQFEFNIDIPHDVDRIDFVLRYQVNEQEHWDNNEGQNYTLETESSSIPQTKISLPHDCDFNEMRFY